jgi:outer membrane autotransporter protein
LGSANQTVRNFGGAIGIDHQISPDLLVGLAAGGSEGNVSVSSLSTTGQITAGHVGIYGVKTWGPYYASAAASYARLDNSTTRNIVGIGPSEVATGKFSSDQFSARFELGWKQVFAHYTLTPFIAIEPAALRAHAYTESSTISGGGLGILGLTFAARTTTSLPTFLGMQVDTRMVFSNGSVLTPYARASWVHEFEPNRQVNAAFITIPAAAFTVDGARAASDAARIDAGAKYALDTTRSLFTNVSGEWSNVGYSISATAGFKLVR